MKKIKVALGHRNKLMIFPMRCTEFIELKKKIHFFLEFKKILDAK